MGPTENFRRQHDELMQLATEIAQQLEEQRLRDNGPAVRRLVSRFAGRLNVHATMENDALYPRLMGHDDPDLRARAQALFDEVSGVYSSFADYAKRWTQSGAIEQNPAGFIKDTYGMFKVLGRRMARENNELYPMVDALEQSA